MSVVLFCVTGGEHAVATWLPTYGHSVGNIDLGEMAMMSAAYWGMICFGRVLWAAISAALSSGFPALAFDGLVMLVSAVLIADYSGGANRSAGGGAPRGETGRLALGGGDAPSSLSSSSSSILLWVGTLGLGFGCSSSLPCAITLPSEAKVELTPYRLLALNLSGSAGEMFFPYLIGLFFERRRFASLGVVLVLLEAAVVFSTVAAWCIARKKAHKSSPWRRGVAGEMGGYFGGSTSTGATSEDRDQLEPMLPLSTADGRSMERDGSAISLQSTHRRSASASSCSSLQSCGHLQVDEDA